MVDKSGVAEQVLVLPKGGGAIRGIGETLVPDERTGAFTVQVPLDVPSGRLGRSPMLALIYSSAMGNGPFGLGWALSLPSIKRSTRRGIPTYETADRFLLGSEDLVRAGGGVVGTLTEDRYRMLGDRAHERVRRFRDHDRNWWEITGLDGVRTVYGDADTAQLRSQDGRIFEWLPTLIDDACGNQVVFAYRRDDGAGLAEISAESGNEYNQCYLVRVDWVNLDGAPDDHPWLYSLRFDYGDLADDGQVVGAWSYRGADSFSTYRSGFELRTVRRCRRILLTTTADDSPGPVRVWELEYQSATGNGASLLRRVSRIGLRRQTHGEVGRVVREEDAPLEFEYTPWRVNATPVIDPSAGSLPTEGLGDGAVELMDGDGLALAGLVKTQSSGQHEYWSNRGSLGWKFTTRTGPPRSLGGNLNVWLADMDGDGYADLLQLGTHPHYYRGIPGGGWETTPTRWSSEPTFDLNDPDTRLVDLDGDGVVDALTLRSTGLVLHANQLERGWQTTYNIHLPAGFPRDVHFGEKSARLHLADVSGDGPCDLVVIGETSVRFWPHMGSGQFAGERSLPVPPVSGGETAHPFGSGFDPRRIRFLDVDGDGYDDLVYVSENEVTVWLNQSGNSWAAPIPVPFGEPSNPLESRLGNAALESLRVVDLLGAGTPGLLWSSKRSGHPARYWFLDLRAGPKPYLLHRADDHRGVVTTVEYQPATTFAMHDLAAGQPWRTRLPFPVHVVTRVISVDEFSETTITSTYRYHEGVWDGMEREFCGFIRVDRVDATEQPADHHGPWSPPVTTRTWYHPGIPLHQLAQPKDRIDEAAIVREEWWPGDALRIVDANVGGALLAELSRSSPGTARRVARALRGQLLRQEEYLANPPMQKDVPYTVIEHVPVLIEVLDGREATDPSWLADPVAHVVVTAERTTRWECGDDPQSRCLYRLNLDEHGRARRVMDVGIPRHRDPGKAAPPGDPYLGTVTERAYADRADDPHRPLDRVAVETTSEILNNGADPLSALVAAVQEGTTKTCLLSATCTRYAAPELTVEPLGHAGLWGLPAINEQLIHTPGTLGEALADAPVPFWLKEAERRAEPSGGLQGHFFAASELGGEPKFSRRDPQIQFAWGALAPDPVLARGPWSATWTGSLVAAETGTRILALGGNGYSRLYVDGQLLLDAWTSPLAALLTTSLDLIAGLPRSLRIDYRPAGPDAELTFWWGPTKEELVPVPATNLSSRADATADEGRYPAEFCSAIGTGGYCYRALPEYGAPAGYYATTMSRSYDLQSSDAATRQGGHGLILVERDAADVETTFDYDPLRLLPKTLCRGGRLERHAVWDYRYQSPSEVRDENDNRITYTYTPLGLLETVVEAGHDGVEEGDTSDQPTYRFQYSLAVTKSLDEDRQPAWIHSIRRVEHRWDTLHAERARRAAQTLPVPTDREVFPDNETEVHPQRFTETREYADGYDRLLQSRTRHAEPVVTDLGLGPRPGGPVTAVQFASADAAGTPITRVHGWTAYDNKGRAITRWEPFFDDGWAYEAPSKERLEHELHHITIQRDPRSIPVRIIFADESEHLVVLGFVGTLEKPDSYKPTVWEITEYDANDNAGRTHPDSGATPQVHWNTPRRLRTDALGRVIEVVEQDNPSASIRINCNLTGNITGVRDVLGRTSYIASYDLAQRPWSETTLDTGTAHSYFDAAGTCIERVDARGSRRLTLCDDLHRPIRIWDSPTNTDIPRLTHVLRYGDDPSGPTDAKSRNLRGRLWQEASPLGESITERYDLHGTPTTLEHRPIHFTSPAESDIKLRQVGDGNPGTKQLDLRPVRISTTADALQRITRRTVNGSSSFGIRYRYGTDGRLTTVVFDTATGERFAIADVATDANRRWVYARQGGVEVRWLYDPLTGRLQRRRAVNSDGAILDDLFYSYDLVGNLVSIEECDRDDIRARKYSYDSRYRLLEASGRGMEHLPFPPWEQGRSDESPVDFHQTYSYDDAGNLLEICHYTEHSHSFRRFVLAEGTNRLTSVTSAIDEDPAVSWTVVVDSAGFLLSDGPNRQFGWDASGHLVEARTPKGHATYGHSYVGDQRSIIVTHGEYLGLTLELGDWLRHHSWADANDGGVFRTFLLRDPTAPEQPIIAAVTQSEQATAFRFTLTDHVGSAWTDWDDSGTTRLRRANMPYGEAAFTKPTDEIDRQIIIECGFAGRRLDESAGFVHMGARPYFPWLARFAAPEPLDNLRTLTSKSLGSVLTIDDPPTRRIPALGRTPYAYADNNPVTLIDPNGRESTQASGIKRETLELEALERLLKERQEAFNEFKESVKDVNPNITPTKGGGFVGALVTIWKVFFPGKKMVDRMAKAREDYQKATEKKPEEKKPEEKKPEEKKPEEKKPEEKKPEEKK